MDLESELIHEISEPYFWQVTLAHMHLTENQRQAFSKHFFTREASRGRRRAIHGTVGLNRLSETRLVGAAEALWASRLPDVETGEHSKLLEDEDGRQWDHARISDEFMSLVLKRDHQAFMKIAGILKRKRDEEDKEDEEDKGDAKAVPAPNHSVAWRLFCADIRERQTLPTKQAFKRVAGLLGQSHGDSNGTKAMKGLGLNGLE